MLEDKLDNARETDSELEQHLKDLTDDHNRKSQALSLDQRCVWGFFLKGPSPVVVFYRGGGETQLKCGRKCLEDGKTAQLISKKNNVPPSLQVR